MMRKFIRKPWAKGVGVLACILVICFTSGMPAWSCDVAVVSARVTTNHRPLIWKNRDCSANWHQQIKYYSPKYAGPGGYLLVFDHDTFALLNNRSPVNPSGGLNEAGFAISCTSVYEEFDQVHEMVNINTELLRVATQSCVTLTDLEALIKVWPLTHAGKVISGNFVAIDAHGGAALYECFSGSTAYNTPVRYYKYDANNGSIVNDLGEVLDPGQGDSFIGFVNRTNSSTFIPYNYGEERRWRATDLMTALVAYSRMNYYTVMREVAKDVVGKQDYLYASSNTNYSTTYCISRAATRLGLVVNGVADGEDPRQCVFWCALGEPSSAVFIPFFPAAGSVTPYAWVDGVGLDGTLYDYNDSCMLNRAFNRREIYDRLMYVSNTGNIIRGMDDKTINKDELAKVQLWIFPLEDYIVARTEQYMSYLRDNPSQLTSVNLRSFSHYCAQYVYENYSQASSDEEPWEFAIPLDWSTEDWIDEIFYS